MFAFILLCVFGLATYSNALFAVTEGARLASIEGTSFNTFELADDINFPATRKVYIEPIEANFSKQWMRKYRSETSRSYRDTTLQKFAESFRSHLIDKLSESGWNVLSAPEEGAIKVNAKLLDIYINGPDTLNMTTALVLYIGKSSLELTIQDANNQLVLRIKDNQIAGSPSESYFETNNAMNLSRFDKAFYGWANNFTVFLNIIAGPTSTS